MEEQLKVGDYARIEDYVAIYIIKIKEIYYNYHTILGTVMNRNIKINDDEFKCGADIYIHNNRDIGKDAVFTHDWSNNLNENKKICKLSEDEVLAWLI